MQSRRPQRPVALALARLAFVLAIASSSLAAQQLVTVGIEGIATGLDAQGFPSTTCVRVAAGPAIHVTFHPGDTAATVAQRLAADLVAQGVAASAAGDLLQIASAQNGAPLRTGVDFATNDVGHTGIVAQIENAAAPGDAKTSGLDLPFVVGGQATVDGSTSIDIDVEVTGPGGPSLQRYSLAVPFFAGWGPTQIEQWVHTQLVLAGLTVQSAAEQRSLLDPLGPLHRLHQLDRDALGRPVRRMAYRPGVSLLQRWMEVHPGRDPIHGTVDYGQPSNHGGGQPLLVSMAQSPAVHLAAYVEVHSAPNRLAVVLLGWAKATLPLPFAAPPALMLVDPTDSMLSYGITDAAGTFTLVVPPPHDPAFAGFRAFFQSADLPPDGNLANMRLSQGLATALFP